MTPPRELTRSRWQQGDALLLLFNFFRNTNDHVESEKRLVISEKKESSQITSHISSLTFRQFKDGSSGAAASILYHGPKPRMISNHRFGRRSSLSAEGLAF